MDRRRFLSVLSALMTGLPLRSALSDSLDLGPPIFRTPFSQFTLLRPTPLIPALDLIHADGTRENLKSLLGKVLVVNFWATWCPPCVKEMPSLDRLERERGGMDFKTLAVSMDRDYHAIQPFFQQHGIGHLSPYTDMVNRVGYFDADNANGAPFALYALPITYVVDHGGRVRGYITGAVDWQSPSAENFLRYFIRGA